MGRIAYVNGRFLPHGQAMVHIEDRGYQLADAVYEVWALFDGRLGDAEGHFTRLERSLSELRIAMPMSRRALGLVLREAVRRNRVREGVVYLQVSRGVAPRDHAFPEGEVRPAVVITVKALDRAVVEARAAKGISVITTPENRWGRCDIITWLPRPAWRRPPWPWRQPRPGECPRAPRRPDSDRCARSLPSKERRCCPWAS